MFSAHMILTSAALRDILLTAFDKAVGTPISLTTGTNYGAPGSGATNIVPWMRAGDINTTILDGSQTVNAGALNFGKQTTPVYANNRVVGTPVVFEDGTIIKFSVAKTDLVNDECVLFGFGDATTDNLRTTGVSAFFILGEPPEIYYVGNDGTAGPAKIFTGGLSSSQYYDFGLAIDKTRKIVHYFFKDGASYKRILAQPYTSVTGAFYPIVVAVASDCSVRRVRMQSKFYPALVSPVLHDSFNYVAADLAGREPDAVTNGNTWINTGDGGGNNRTAVDGSKAVLVQDGGATFNIMEIDTGVQNHAVLSLVLSDNDVINTSANYLSVRRQDVNNRCTITVDHNNSVLRLEQILAGVPTTLSVAYNPPEGTPFPVYVFTNGTTVTAIAGTATVTAAIDPALNSSMVGFWCRTFAHNADFKVYTTDAGDEFDAI